jgi:hypothetical protein
MVWLFGYVKTCDKIHNRSSKHCYCCVKEAKTFFYPVSHVKNHKTMTTFRNLFAPPQDKTLPSFGSRNKDGVAVAASRPQRWRQSRECFDFESGPAGARSLRLFVLWRRQCPHFYYDLIEDF